MKNEHITFKRFMFFFLILSLQTSELRPQKAIPPAPPIPKVVSVPTELYRDIKGISDTINYLCSEKLQCPQTDLANAKNLAEAIEQVIITLELYKGWIQEGLLPNREDAEWQRAQRVTDAAYADITKAQKEFYNAVSKIKIYPQSYKGAPGPTAPNPYTAILRLNPRLKPQVRNLRTLMEKFELKPAANPVMKINGTSFKPGQEIVVDFTAPPCYPENAWIGLIPSEILHQDEATSEKNKIVRKHISNRTSDKFTFKAPEKEGSYDFRMFDSDDNGNEVASTSFVVSLLEPESQTTIQAKKNVSKGDNEIVYVPVRNNPSKTKGYLVIPTPISGCTGKDSSVRIEVRKNGAFAASSMGPSAKDKNRYEQKPPPYRFELEAGVYDVTMEMRYVTIKKRVTVKAGTETILSRGKVSGKLEIRFLNESGGPMKAWAFKIFIHQGQKQLYTDNFWNHATYDSGFLPTGNYTVTLIYTAEGSEQQEKHVTDIAIGSCEIVTIDCYKGAIKNRGATARR